MEGVIAALVTALVAALGVAAKLIRDRSDDLKVLTARLEAVESNKKEDEGGRSAERRALEEEACFSMIKDLHEWHDPERVDSLKQAANRGLKLLEELLTVLKKLTGGRQDEQSDQIQ